MQDYVSRDFEERAKLFIYLFLFLISLTPAFVTIISVTFPVLFLTNSIVLSLLSERKNFTFDSGNNSIS